MCSNNISEHTSFDPFTLIMITRTASLQYVQERVYQELTDVLGDDEVFSIEQLKNLKYLEACIKEALRIYNPIPFVVRKLNEPTVIGKRLFEIQTL